MSNRESKQLAPDRAKIISVEEWASTRQYSDDILEKAKEILIQIQQGEDVFQAIRKNPVPNRGNVAKHALVHVYRQMVDNGTMQEDLDLLAKIRMKPTRSLSGVTTVTVLTKPYPCSGNCIFCPTDDRMPKSYLPDEPGAARAYQNDFDPFDQVKTRLKAYEAVGHPTDKIELLILGGSWTDYPDEYQKWFIHRCFDAMNEEDSDDLEIAQHKNESAKHRNVGLVIETRPDEINANELKKLRQLGVTKIQIGIQSLNDEILTLNRRGHTVAQALSCASLCRAAGFKLVMHWMPNLLGATPESDRKDFALLWSTAKDGLGFCPDELKIYPTQLLENADLFHEWESGNYQPYDDETLVDLISDIKSTIEPYCRVNRVIRDIPSHHIIEGSKRSSLRMDIQKNMKSKGTYCQCIRCREVKNQAVIPETLIFEDFTYHAANAEEHFLQYLTPEGKLAGYLRLSFPDKNAPSSHMKELDNAAIIREIHIYGQSIPVGQEQSGAAQHIGLGTKLIEIASTMTKEAGFTNMAVIAAIGTRKYYESRGFHRTEFYMVKSIEQEKK